MTPSSLVLTDEQIELLRNPPKEIAPDDPSRSPDARRLARLGLAYYFNKGQFGLLDAGVAVRATLDSQADRIREEERGRVLAEVDAALDARDERTWQALLLNKTGGQWRVQVPDFVSQFWPIVSTGASATEALIAATTPQPEGQEVKQEGEEGATTSAPSATDEVESPEPSAADPACEECGDQGWVAYQYAAGEWSQEPCPKCDRIAQHWFGVGQASATAIGFEAFTHEELQNVIGCLEKIKAEHGEGFEEHALKKLKRAESKHLAATPEDQTIEPDARVAEWQPIETAPKDGSVVVLSDGKYVAEGSWWTGDTDGVHKWISESLYEGEPYELENVTHWQPRRVIEPPTPEDGEAGS